METIKLLEQCLRNFCSEKDNGLPYKLFTDDVHCFGIGENADADNCEELAASAVSGYISRFKGHKFEIVDGKNLTDDSAAVVFTVAYDGGSVAYRLVGNSRMTENGRRLFLLNFSFVNPCQAVSILSKISCCTRNSDTDIDGQKLPPQDNEVGSDEGMNLYRVDDDFVLTPISAQGREKNYCDRVNNVFEEDKSALRETVRETVVKNKSTALIYRVHNSAGGCSWINGFFSKFGTDNGMPVIRAFFAPASLQYELQLQALNQDETGVCIIDAKTNELYYANDAAFVLHGTTPGSYIGKTCCEAFYGEGQACDKCWRNNLPEGENHTIANCRGKLLSVTSDERQWNGRSVIIVYQRDITEQLALQKSVEESNRELQQLMRNINCGVCVSEIGADKKYLIKYISDGFCKMFGGSKENLEKRHMENPVQGIYPDDLPKIMEFHKKCSESPCSDEITYRYKNINGEMMWLTLKAVTIEDGNGGLLNYATYVDVTELMKYQRQFSDVVHNVPGGVCMFRMNKTGIEPIIVSRQIAGLFGESPDRISEMLCTMDYGVVHGEDIENLHKTVHESLSHPGEMYSYTYRIWNRKKNEYRWISTQGVTVLQDDGTKVLYANYTDVNESKKLERRIIQEEEMLHAACDLAHIWTWIYDIPNNCAIADKLLQTEFGFPDVEENYPEGSIAAGFILPEYVPLYRDKVAALKNGSSNEELEINIRYKNGELHWCHILMKRVADNTRLAVCTAQLIDVKKVLQARLELERKKILVSNKSIVGWIISDLNQNIVLECEAEIEDIPLITPGMTIDEGLDMAYEGEYREEYLKLHNRTELLAKYQRGITSFDFEGRLKMTNGTLRWMRSAMNILRDPSTGNILLYEYIYDINAQKILEEIMTATAKYDYEMVASINITFDHMSVVNQDNPDMFRALEEWDYSEHMKEYCQACVIREDRGKFMDSISLTHVSSELADKDCYEFISRIYEADGKIGYRRTRFSYYNRDLKICLMTRADVTKVMETEERKSQQLSEALKQAQNALSAKEEVDRVRELVSAALFNIVPMVISSNLTQNYYSMLNYDNYTTKTAAKSGSYDELVMIGVKTVPNEQRELFSRTFDRRNVIEAYNRGKKSIALEHQQLGDDGVMRWIETRCIFVKYESGDDLYTITLAQDITSRKQSQVNLEIALEAAETATRAKSEFLSRMSHEIRTPMNAIMGMTAIAKENRSDYIQVGECLEKIDMSSHFLLTLINDILNMSRIESGSTEIKHHEFGFDFLVESIDTVVEPLAMKSGVRYEFINNAKNDAHYIGDETRIQQVLVNLIGNAIKFTKAGGRVRFSIEILSENESHTTFQFTVADTGIGMSSEFMKKMYKPFTQEDGSNTSEYGGSGLGLAISKSLIETMNGKISVESFLGIGTTFCVDIPLDRLTGKIAEPKSAVRIKDADISVLNGKQILIAEDHPLNVMVARKILERRGIIVTVAENGKIAADMFAASKEGFFDAVLMDIRMPVMDGLDSTRTIRAMKRSDASRVPIIAMTANALDEDRLRTREAGMNEHLAKPFEPQQLYKVLAEQIILSHSEEQA